MLGWQHWYGSGRTSSACVLLCCRRPSREHLFPPTRHAGTNGNSRHSGLWIAGSPATAAQRSRACTAVRIRSSRRATLRQPTPGSDRHTQTYSSLGLAQSQLWTAGTLCITIAANIAKTGLLTSSTCFPDSVVGFIAHDGPMATRWVELVIRSMQDRLEQLAPATAQKNINLAVLRALEISYPALAYQVEVLSEYDRQMSLLGALRSHCSD